MIWNVLTFSSEAYSWWQQKESIAVIQTATYLLYFVVIERLSLLFVHKKPKELFYCMVVEHLPFPICSCETKRKYLSLSTVTYSMLR